MKQKFFRFLSYLSMFTLGVYASSQFRFNQSIEPHRWVMTSLCFIFFLFLSNDKK